MTGVSALHPGQLRLYHHFMPTFLAKLRSMGFRATFRANQLEVTFDVQLATALGAFLRGILAGRLGFAPVECSLDLNFCIRSAIQAQVLGFVPAQIANKLVELGATMKVAYCFRFRLTKGFGTYRIPAGLGYSFDRLPDTAQDIPEYT